MTDRLTLFVVRDAVTRPASPDTTAERIVALCIADHMGDEGKAWPSLRRIGTWTGLGRTAVREAVATLCSGPKAVFDRTPGGARSGSRYEATVYRVIEGVATRGGREASGSPSGAEGVATRPEGVASRTRGGRHANAERLNRTAQGKAHRTPHASAAQDEHDDSSTRAAEKYITAFNGLFRRRVALNPAIVASVREALAAGYKETDLIVALFAASQDKWVNGRERDLSPDWFLRFKGGKDGQPVKKWLPDLLHKAEFVLVMEDMRPIAERAGVVDALKERGAQFEDVA